MKSRVYIAGSCKNRIAIKGLMNYVESFGHKITVDWTIRTKNDYAKAFVEEDIEGMKVCDYFIYCMDGIKSRGKYFELGYATALNKNIGIYLLPTYYDVINPNSENLPFNIIIENESIFIRSKRFPILRTIDELRTWLSN